MLSLWLVGASYADVSDDSLSYFFDTPIAGNHPTKMLIAILVLLWAYFLTCLITAAIEKCYGWIKFTVIYLVICVALVLTSNVFKLLFLFV